VNKNNKLFLLLLLLALVLGAGGFFVYNRYVYRKPDAGNFINKIREENKAGFDSLQHAINYENDLNYRINKSIHAGDFNTAYSLMDSLPAFGKTNTIHLYKGMIYAEQKKYTEAIEEYNKVLDKVPYSKAKGMRAEVYVKMTKPELALSDYKEIYQYNHYYSLHVANTFMLMNKKDSALKYYQIYLEHYPNDTAIQQKTRDHLAN
jgi:tetratricopeptide (TPR) repeat protein